MVLGQYLRCNPQRQYELLKQLYTRCFASTGNVTPFMNWGKPHPVGTSRECDLRPIAFRFISACSFVINITLKKKRKGLKVFLMNPQFSSVLVRLLKGALAGYFRAKFLIIAAFFFMCFTTPPPRAVVIIVRLELGTKWESLCHWMDVFLDAQHVSMLELPAMSLFKDWFVGNQYSWWPIYSMKVMCLFSVHKYKRLIFI